MKKLLALLMVVATVFCVAACEKDPEPATTTTTTTKNETTTTTTTPVADTDATTDPSNVGETTTDPSNVGETTTTTSKLDGTTTTTTTIKPTTTTSKPVETTVKPGINGVDPANSANWDKVVNGVYTSSNGGIQIKANGWKTYAASPLISFVPEKYNNVGVTNAVCVAVYAKGEEGYDSASVFENKTQADFESVLQTAINSFEKTTISSNGKTYTCYRAIVTDAYNVWVFQTPEAKYFINFMQAPIDQGGYPFANDTATMISSLVIYK